MLNPGLATTPAAFTFEEQGTLAPCGTAGGLLTATYSVVHGHGEGTCLTAHFAAPVTFSWSDGTVSTAMAVGDSFGATVVAKAKLVQGRFTGWTYRFLAFLTTPDPLRCGSTGVREATVHGKMDFLPPTTP